MDKPIYYNIYWWKLCDYYVYRTNFRDGLEGGLYIFISPNLIYVWHPIKLEQIWGFTCWKWHIILGCISCQPNMITTPLSYCNDDSIEARRDTQFHTTTSLFIIDSWLFRIIISWVINSHRSQPKCYWIYYKVIPYAYWSI